MASQDTLSLSKYTPKPSPVADLPTTDPLTQDQWRTILAFADTVVPCIRPIGSARKGIDLALPENDYAATLSKVEQYASFSGNPDLATQYLSERPSESQAFKDNLYRLLALYCPDDLRQQLTLGLTLLK
jgi:hypothetical protein